MSRFIDVRLTPKNIDIYYQRTAILKALDNHLPMLSGRLLDVGCGQMPYRERILSGGRVSEYVGLDIETALDYGGPAPDITWNGEKIPLEDDGFDCAMATEVFEHCPEPDKIMKEICRVIKPGGLLFFTVPFLWPLHEIPHDEYRYTPFAMSRLLSQSGFTDVRLESMGGWDASLAQMLGLWLRRRGIPSYLRLPMSWVVIPGMKLLFRFDRKPVDFNGGYMLTGISGTAQKIGR